MKHDVAAFETIISGLNKTKTKQFCFSCESRISSWLACVQYRSRRCHPIVAVVTPAIDLQQGLTADTPATWTPLWHHGSIYNGLM